MIYIFTLIEKISVTFNIFQQIIGCILLGLFNVSFFILPIINLYTNPIRYIENVIMIAFNKIEMVN